MSKKVAMVRARTTKELKDAAELILRALGMTPSEAINIFYSQIVLKKRIPFEISLEEGDESGNYTEIKDTGHFKSLIGLEE